MNYENPFDRLVSELGKDERLTLLEKLSTASLPASETENVEAPDKIENSDLNYDIQTKLKSESVLLRFWLFLKSVFTGINQRVIYNDLLIDRKAKALTKKFPNIYDMKKKSLLTDFFVELKNLHQAADFYKSGIAAYEENPGEAYVFLGSLFLSDLYECKLALNLCFCFFKNAVIVQYSCGTKFSISSSRSTTNFNATL